VGGGGRPRLFVKYTLVQVVCTQVVFSRRYSTASLCEIVRILNFTKINVRLPPGQSAVTHL
jgi:hypothetical protein